MFFYYKIIFIRYIREIFNVKEVSFLEEKQNELYIPSNIKTRLEFFKGYGVKEMVITLIVMAFSLPIIYISLLVLKLIF